MTVTEKSVPVERKPRWGSALLLVFAQSTQALTFGSIALFLPLLRSDLGISFGQAGILAAASTFTYALMQIPAGYIADRFDPKRIFLLGLVGVNVLSFLFVIWLDYPVMVANQAVSGIFRALLFAPGMILITRQFRTDQRATAMGLFVAGGFSSNLVVNLLAPFLVVPLGWRGILMLFSVTGLLVAVLFWRAVNGGSNANRAPAPAREIVPTLFEPVMLLVAVVQFTRLALVTGMAFWLPSILQEDKGMSIQLAGALVALGAVVTAPSNILGGFVSDRLGKPVTLIVVSMTAISITTVLLAYVDDMIGIIVVVALNAMFLQLYFGPLFALATHLLPHRPAGLLTGVGNFWANAGGFTASIAMGAIKESTGSFDVGLYGLSGLCLIGITAALGLHWISRKRPPAIDANT